MSRQLPLVALALLLVPAAAVAQDVPDDHDKYGFPITFDTEVLTLTDLVRAQGLDRVEQIGRIGTAGASVSSMT